MSVNEYWTVGLMSGTSLDGVDLTLTKFVFSNGHWDFELAKAKTYAYPQGWKNILSRLNYNTPAFEYLKIDQEYGDYLGNILSGFLSETEHVPLFIASHGHTIFHQPSKGVTSQIGNANNIAAATGIPVINDFRSKDVALKGQGAPLVPFGDLYLFEDYKYCLNLGGFANISIKKNSGITAFDICPVNIVLNALVADLDMDYDTNGEIGRKGRVVKPLLETLDQLNYYKENGPKSLGKEWVEEYVNPLLYWYNIPIEDKIRTMYAHVAKQIGDVLDNDNEKLLITGGGAFNTFLMELLSESVNQKIIIPSEQMVSFKEAILFSFLGLMRYLGQNNVLSSVTGSKVDNCGGGMYL